MKLMIAMMGLTVLSVAPGNAREMRDARMPPKGRQRAAERNARPLRRIRGDRREDAIATTSRVAIAIDSETGEHCFVNGKRAGLLKR